ncbi:hypothetical protein [Ruegeria conchae]|uniref:DUF2946 family protein n=1 Tax=Ruegeria conchae TaxID=981384 RepID=A0A497ZPI0_9RHOB|nr:hypothetical protein [Ruegeria conchae]RLK11358.1 hypothetical protein CLV75_1359 [Ruegeria conchae]UWR02110.1 hypothetical protein K3740_13720 [Ruegeria conchae]
MKDFFRQILPYALSLLVLVTGQGLAASRGIDRAVGQMVLCTGTGPVVVYMDDEGQPTRAPHYCPDYALSLLGAVHDARAALPLAPSRALPAPPLRSADLISAPLPRHPARAPPISV